MLNERISIQITQPFTTIMWVVPCIRAPSTASVSDIQPALLSPSQGAQKLGKHLGASSLIEKSDWCQGKGLICQRLISQIHCTNIYCVLPKCENQWLRFPNAALGMCKTIHQEREKIGTSDNICLYFCPF